MIRTWYNHILVTKIKSMSFFVDRRPMNMPQFLSESCHTHAGSMGRAGARYNP